MTHLHIRFLSSFSAMLLLAAGAVADEEQGRISYATDEALVRGDGEDDWSFAGINTLVLDGDRLWADDSGAIEVELPDGYYVRLADGSELEVVQMPPDGVVRGWVGSFYIQRLEESGRNLLFDTGAAQFDFEADTVARFDVLTDGSTTLSVVEGRVGVNDERGRVMDVSEGYRTYIDPGLLPSPPERFTMSEDTFDVWNRTRVTYIDGYVAPEAFQSQEYVQVGARDLNDYGDWVYVDNSYYWRPSYVDNYVPYRYGYWGYYGNQGHAWVGYYPFDYYTSHYGYWDYNRRYGWLWSYDPYYSPARVTSIYYGDVLFWAPCNRYGYPVYGSYFDLTIGGFYFSLAFSSYCYSDYVYYSNYYNPCYYVQPLHRYVIADQPRHVQPQIWNHSTRTDLAHFDQMRRNGGLRDWSGDTTGRVRGFTENERRGEARTLASNLQDRHGRTEFETGGVRAAAGGTRTSSASNLRLARAREIDTITDRGFTEVEAAMEGGNTDRTGRSTSTVRTPSMDDDLDRGDVRLTTVPTRSNDPDRGDTVRGSSSNPDRNGDAADPGRGDIRTPSQAQTGGVRPSDPSRYTDNGGTRTGDPDRGGGDPDRGSDPRDTGGVRTTTAQPNTDRTKTYNDDPRSQPPVTNIDRFGNTSRGSDVRSSEPQPSPTRSTGSAPDRSQPAVRSTPQYQQPSTMRAPSQMRSAPTGRSGSTTRM